MNCCKKPKVSTLSEKDYRIGEDGYYHEHQLTNKICLNCDSHQYGRGEGKFYTKQQWDNIINAAFSPGNI